MTIRQFYCKFREDGESGRRPVSIFVRLHGGGVGADFVLAYRCQWMRDDLLLRAELGIDDSDIAPVSEAEAMQSLIELLADETRARKIFADTDHVLEKFAKTIPPEEFRAGPGSLSRAILLASKAHEGQRDEYGGYVHQVLLEVMNSVRGYPAQTVALFHRLIADTRMTLADLNTEGYSPAIVRAVDAITRRDNEELQEWIARLKESPLAVEVKRAEISCGFQEFRLLLLPEPRQSELREEYRRTLELLGASPR